MSLVRSLLQRRSSNWDILAIFPRALECLERIRPMQRSAVPANTRESEMAARMAAVLIFAWIRSPGEDKSLAHIVEGSVDRDTGHFEYYCLRAFALSVATNRALTDSRKRTLIAELVVALLFEYPESPLRGLSRERIAQRIHEYEAMREFDPEGGAIPPFADHFSRCCTGHGQLTVVLVGTQVFYQVLNAVTDFISEKSMRDIIAQI